MALFETARMLAQLGFEDKMSPGLKRAGSNLSGFESKLGRVGQGAGKISSGLAKAGTRIAVGVGVGLAATAKAAIDWQDAFQGVVKTVDASDQQLDALALTLRDMSTRMPTTAIDLAHIAEAAGQMGVGFDKATGKTNTAAIAAFTEQVAILAETTNVTAEDGAMALGQLTNVIHLGADEFDNFAASLVALGNAGASTESQILEIAKRSGGAADAIGIAKEETLGWAAAAANLGINQELAGTGLQKFFLQTQTIISKGGKPFAKLAKIAGMTGRDFKKAFRKDATGALEDFIQGLGKLPGDQRIKAVQDLFGTTSGLNRLLIGLAGNAGDLSQTLDLGVDSWFKSAAAAEEFAKRNQTVQSAISRLKNGIIDAAVSIGEGFAPALGRAADKLAEFLRQDENRTALKTLGQDIGKAIDGIDWHEVLTGAQEFVGIMRVAFDYAKRIFDVVNSLPKEVKAAGLGFLALNKLSGGLIGSGVGDVVGGLSSALAKSLAASIPGVGRAFVQPVLVTNFPPGFGVGGVPGGAPGKPGGKLNSLGTAIDNVARVAIVATVAQETQGLRAEVAHDLHKSFFSAIPTIDPGQMQWPFGPKNTPTILPEVFGGNGLLGGTAGGGLKDAKPLGGFGGPSSFSEASKRDSAAVIAAVTGSKTLTVAAINGAADTFDRATLDSKAATVAALSTVGGQVTGGALGTMGAVNGTTAAVNALNGAIHSMPPPQVTVDITNNVSAADITNKTVVRNRAGGNQSSRNGGGGGTGNPGQTWGGGQ